MEIEYDADVHTTVPCHGGERVPAVENGEGDTICGFVKDDGMLCPSTVGVPKFGGLCAAHQQTEADRDKNRSRTDMGPLRASDLPPLDCHEHAELWLDKIGRAVAVGNLEASRAQAALRAVSEFNKTRAEKITSDEMKRLEERIEEIQEEVGAEQSYGGF